MKKAIGALMALVLTVTGISASGFGGIDAAAAGRNFASPATNISMATAQAVPADTPVQGSFANDDEYLQRWYSFTNPYNTQAVASVTFTKEDGNNWPNYTIYDNNGAGFEGIDYSSYFSGSKTIYVGLEAGEKNYFKVYSQFKNNTAWTAVVSFKTEEGNSFKTAKSVKSGKTIYGNIDYDGDEDYFKIKAKKSGKMTITINNNAGGEYIYKPKYSIHNKARAVKKSYALHKAETVKYKIKVKKGQSVYVKVHYDGEEYLLGDYTIQTKIK